MKFGKHTEGKVGICSFGYESSDNTDELWNFFEDKLTADNYVCNNYMNFSDMEDELHKIISSFIDWCDAIGVNLVNRKTDMLAPQNDLIDKYLGIDRKELEIQQIKLLKRMCNNE